MAKRRTLAKNKQNMYYSLFVESSIVYAYDDDGNKIIDGYYKDGSPIYRELGTRKAQYSTPIAFKSCITGKLNEMHAKEYGIDQSSVYSELSCEKGYLPLVYGAKVWKDNEISWVTEGVEPDADSADYTVVGLLTEYQDYDFFLMQRNNVKSND